MQPRMHESWLAVLADELEQPYMADLRAFLVAEVQAGRRFFPPADRVFNAMALTPFDAVRVVILGQDPYHGPGQAMGLCFSVPPGVAQPPSLQNIFKELSTRPRAPGAGDGRPDPLGGARRPAAERRADRLAPQRRVTRRRRAGSASPTARWRSSRHGARGSSSCSGAGTHSRRARSSTAPATTCSRRPIRRRTRRLLRVPALLAGERAARAAAETAAPSEPGSLVACP